MDYFIVLYMGITYEIGDIILLNEKFDIKKVNTWLNPFVKFFVNLWNLGDYINYSHCGIVAMYEGELYFWESVKDGFLPTESVYTRFKGIENDILILRPNDYLTREQRDKINSICWDIMDRDYDYHGVLLLQYVYTISNRMLWLGKKDYDYSKKFYCVESVCYIYNKLSNKYFTNWAKCSQKDLYLSNHFQHLKHTNL